MKRAGLMVLAFAAAALAGCSSAPSWNPFDWFGGSSGPKPAPLVPLTGAQAVRVLWSARIGEAGPYVFRPAYVSGTVYVASRDGSVAAIDAQTGAERWRARVSSEVLAPPAVDQGLVVVRSGDSRVFGFAQSDGKRQWVYQRAAAPLAVRSPAGITLVPGYAVLGFAGGKLVAIALSNGAPRWEATVAPSRGATELERITDVLGEPVLREREVCAAAYQGRVACFDVRGGNQVWSRPLSSLTGLSIDARNAYISDDRGAVHALDLDAGRSVWKQDQLAHRQLTVPVPVGPGVAVGDLEGYVHFLARDSGAFVARTATDATPIRAAPLQIPDGVVVQTLGGAIIALAL